MTKRLQVDEVFEAYERYRHSQWIRFAGMSAVVAGTLVPIFSVLDYLVYPEWFETFVQLRFGCTISIVLLTLFSAYTGNRHIKLFTMIGALLIQIMINFMVVVAGGAESGYYAGLNLTVIAMGLILPAMLYETMLFSAATAILYVAACVVSGYGGTDVALAENLFFLVGTGVIASFSTHFLEKRRYKEFLLSYELEQRNKELDELNHRRAEFFANVSHELRTPLTLILAPVQELLSGSIRLTDQLASRLGVIRDNGLRLLKLVNDLLDVIRLEEGKEALEHVRVNLGSALRGIVEGMSYLADTKEIALVGSYGPENAVVDVDLRALEKILVNLIGNAIKFTDKQGAVHVEIKVEGSDAVVCVRDTGIGIDKKEQAQIFDRFHQVDASSTRRYRGTGLGLALVKELTERMGGSVEVESEIGKGTCMSIRFPLARDAPVSLTLPAQEEDELERMHRQAEQTGGLTVDDRGAVEELEKCETDRPKLVIVEDEPDMRRYLVDLLEEEYQVLQARTGQAGLRMALENDPELVLLDLMLPEMDGLEVCRRIRASETEASPKIMLLTARVDDESKITALKNGADDFLTKPFSSVEVKTRLRNLAISASLERDLADRNRSLEGALKELKQTQAQLIQSEKLNALGSLAAGLLHEINNPLNYSLTALQLIRGDAAVRDSELAQEVIGDIDEGMQRIRAIVSDLRAFAYPSEAEKRSPFDIGEALESAMRFTSHELKGIVVAIDLPRDIRVLGSKNHLTQVLVNLLTNSAMAIREAGGERPGEIVVTGATADARLTVTVRDNGVGMGEKTLDRIFDPFFTTRDVGEGMGLGLSICHTIIANHGGQLLAFSRPGEGAELVFDLPLAEGA